MRYAAVLARGSGCNSIGLEGAISLHCSAVDWDVALQNPTNQFRTGITFTVIIGQAAPLIIGEILGPITDGNYLDPSLCTIDGCPHSADGLIRFHS